MKVSWKSIIALSLLFTFTLVKANENNNNSNLTFEHCHLEGIKQQVKCGQLLVPENYQQENSEKISINFAVLPAIDNSKNKEPLMFLAGGPGQGAVSLAGGLYRAFNEIRKTRDLILVDQRGTGESHPLQCENALDVDVYSTTPEDFSAADVKECLASLTGDLAQYNSENAIRDFDEVRKALSHEKIAIYGGSYGTRAGLVYMRLFPESLSAVILDSVGPIEVPIGIFGQSSARSFSMLLENCRKALSCQKAYPNLEAEFNHVVESLENAPISINIPHPRLGTQTKHVVNKNKFISTLFMQLYSVETRKLIPLIIHQAYQGNYAPIAGLTAMSEDGAGIFIGLHLNIVCNEDYPRISNDMFTQDANNNFNGELGHKFIELACPLWPQYRPSEAFYSPVMVDIPTLIISGDLDPVTPPSNGDFPAKTLPNNKHIIMKNSGHTPGSSACGIDIINEFLTTKNPNDLNETCLEEIPEESFMTGLNGGI